MLASILLSLAGSSTYLHESSWSDAAIVRFGNLTIDFERGELRAPGIRQALANCSDAGHFCLSAPDFALILPRDCKAFQAGASWASGGTRTRLLHMRVSPTPPTHGGSRARAWVGSSERPGLAFQYDLLRGVTYIVWDRSGGTDFVAMAERGEMDSWLFDWSRDPLKRPYVFGRTSPVTFGACRGTPII